MFTLRNQMQKSKHTLNVEWAHTQETNTIQSVNCGLVTFQLAVGITHAPLHYPKPAPQSLHSWIMVQIARVHPTLSERTLKNINIIQSVNSEIEALQLALGNTYAPLHYPKPTPLSLHSWIMVQIARVRQTLSERTPKKMILFSW